MAVTPPPINTPIVSDNGSVSPVWARWLNSISGEVTSTSDRVYRAEQFIAKTPSSTEIHTSPTNTHTDNGVIVGLTATGLLNAIQLVISISDSIPTSAIIEVWEAISNSRQLATLIGTSFALTFVRNGLPLNTTRYYWVRIKYAEGTYGEYFPSGVTAGIAGTTSTSASDILSILQGQITSGQLASDLLTPIDLIATAIPEAIMRLVESSDSSRRSDSKSSILLARTLGADGTAISQGLIYDLQQVVSTATGALASDISGLSATILGADGTGTTAGTIYQERLVRVSAEGAIASDVSTLSSTVGGHTSSISSLSSSVNGIYSQYTVKIDSNGHITGFGLYGDATYSQFIVLADQFAIMNVASSPQTSGSLVIGKWYQLRTFLVGDNFTNVGGVNASYTIFKATGTTPTTWTHSSSLYQINVPFVTGTVGGVSTIGIDGNLIIDGSVIIGGMLTAGTGRRVELNPTTGLIHGFDASNNELLDIGISPATVGHGGYAAGKPYISITDTSSNVFLYAGQLYYMGYYAYGVRTGGVELVGSHNIIIVNGSPVVGSRQTGWGTPTGTLYRTALTDASTQTQYNQALMALITDIKTHGLIGA
jgi:hypothetical protein